MKEMLVRLLNHSESKGRTLLQSREPHLLMRPSHVGNTFPVVSRPEASR